MALRRLSMRKIHTTLRLFFEAGLSIRAIARTLRVSPEVPAKAGMGDDLRRAKGAGLSWSLPEGMDERALEARLFPGAGAACDAAVGARSHRAAAQGGHPVAAVAGVQGRASRWDSVQPVLRALPRLSTSRCPTTPSNSPCPPTTTTSAGRPASTEPPQETPPMLTHPTIDKLHQLRCPAMAAALAEPLHSPHRDALSFEEPSACSPTANSPCATTAACPAGCDAPSCDTPTPDRGHRLPTPTAPRQGPHPLPRLRAMAARAPQRPHHRSHRRLPPSARIGGRQVPARLCPRPPRLP